MIAKVSVLKSFAILAKNVYNGNHFYLIINHMKQDSSFHFFRLPPTKKELWNKY